MLSLFFELSLVVVLVVLNGFFSLSEIALLSAKKSRLRQLAKQGNARAQTALALVRRSSEMLSGIQIGITTVGIFAGAFSGATIAGHLGYYLQQFPAVAPYSSLLSVVIVVVCITYFSLIIGELVPKQIALSNPEKISLSVTRPIYYFLKLANPLVKVLSASSLFVLRLMRIHPTSEQAISEEEIKLLIAEGTETGVFEKTEQKMVESIFHLGNRPIKDFVTPRSEVVWLDINDPFEIIKDKITRSDRSVFPVCDGSLNNNLGVVEVKDVVHHALSGTAINLKKIIQPIMRIDVSVPSLVAIERLKRSAISIALITEKDAVVGIISFHDILEAIVGEFKHA